MKKMMEFCVIVLTDDSGSACPEEVERIITDALMAARIATFGVNLVSSDKPLVECRLLEKNEDRHEPRC